MEIERKFLIGELPFNVEDYPSRLIEQAYLCTGPVVRIRKEDDTYYMTYKNGGGMAHEEANLPLTEEAYRHLLEKHDGKVITKRRFLIPYGKFTIELDVFSGAYEGLRFAEVEFESVEEALSFTPPSWFTEDVTADPRFHNSHLALGDVNPFTK